jgi:hypothetical protein
MRTQQTKIHDIVVGTLAREEGVALVMAVLLLLLGTGISVAAIFHAGGDFSLTGSSRRATRMLYAADGGIQVAINQIAQPTPDLNPFNLTLEGGDVTIRSGTRDDTVAQPLLATGSGPPPDGFSINIGSGFRTRLYRANVSSFYRSGATAEVEGKFGRMESGHGGY